MATSFDKQVIKSCYTFFNELSCFNMTVIVKIRLMVLDNNNSNLLALGNRYVYISVIPIRKKKRCNLRRYNSKTLL